MINPNDAIRFQNVVSRKYTFHYSDMEKAIKDFTSDLKKLGCDLVGPLFYSLNNIPLDEIMLVEFFMPVENDYVEVMEDMQFHSYFSIENMASTCLFHDFENQTEVAYAMLVAFLDKNGLEQATPMFHVLSGDESLNYVFIKCGYKKIDNMNVWK